MEAKLEQLRAALNENLDNEARGKIENAVMVIEGYQQYQKKTVFKVGDAVRWKKGLKARSVPDKDEVGVVAAVMDEPVIDSTHKSAGDALFREPLTLRVALKHNSAFFEFYLDGSRLEVVPDSELTSAQKEMADALRDFLEQLEAPRSEPLKPGDVVRWKTGMKITRRPQVGERCVVIETFPPIRAERRGACSTGFLEPIDIRLCMMDDDGDMPTYCFDSRRFEKVPESEV